MFSWLLRPLYINQILFYHRPDTMLVLKINPIVGFVANYLCLALGYLGKFLYYKTLTGWPWGNLLKKNYRSLHPWDRSWFLLKEICITMSFEFFYRTGAPKQVEDGNFRLNIRFLEHSSVAWPPANHPSSASCFWGPVMTILLGLLFDACLFYPWEAPTVSN